MQSECGYVQEIKINYFVDGVSSNQLLIK
jgi:hypothetical protein